MKWMSSPSISVMNCGRSFSLASHLRQSYSLPQYRASSWISTSGTAWVSSLTVSRSGHRVAFTQASNFKTRNPKHGTLDLAQLHAGWADKLRRTLGVPLASVAPSVWHSRSRRVGPRTRGAEGAVLTGLELARAAQKAVALAQQDKSAWTRADVIKYLGLVLPRSGMDPAAAAALLEDLADRALASEFEPVACLDAPEPAEVPASLLRAEVFNSAKFLGHLPGRRGRLRRAVRQRY